MPVIQVTIPRVYTVLGVRLMPGANELDSLVYTKLKTHPSVKDKLEKGIFVDHGKPVEVPEPTPIPKKETEASKTDSSKKKS